MSNCSESNSSTHTTDDLESTHATDNLDSSSSQHSQASGLGSNASKGETVKRKKKRRKSGFYQAHPQKKKHGSPVHSKSGL